MVSYRMECVLDMTHKLNGMECVLDMTHTLMQVDPMGLVGPS
jgi:hypothetical protein